MAPPPPLKKGGSPPPPENILEAYKIMMVSPTGNYLVIAKQTILRLKARF